MNRPWLLPTARLGLLALAALVSVRAFSSSAAGIAFGGLLAGDGGLLTRLPALGLDALSPVQATWAVALLGILAQAVLLNLLVPARQLAVLAGVFLLLHLPSILSHSALDWGRFLLRRPEPSFPLVSPVETTALALGAVAALLAASMLARWQGELSRLAACGAETSDVDAHLRNSLSLGGRVIGGAALATALVLLLALGVSSGSQGVFGLVPWPAVVLGAGAVALVLVATYFIATRWLGIGQVPPKESGWDGRR
ncbi:MAG: hypothetical protein HY680_11640 [Chloroflexi bacterium]|nr:hypothetical protein [Chloroflexota bacterium]